VGFSPVVSLASQRERHSMGTAATKRAQYGIGARDNLQEVGDATAPDVDIEIDVEADAISATP
jgi:hypothetical protein